MGPNTDNNSPNWTGQNTVARLDLQGRVGHVQIDKLSDVHGSVAGERELTHHSMFKAASLFHQLIGTVDFRALITDIFIFKAKTAIDQKTQISYSTYLFLLVARRCINCS